MNAPTTGLWILVPDAGSRKREYEAQEQGFGTGKATEVTRELLGNAEETWRELTQQLGAMLTATSDAIGNYQLESVTVKLGMDGKGSLGVVTAGVSASFEIKFERK
jgi:hypothetical protein